MAPKPLAGSGTVAVCARAAVADPPAMILDRRPVIDTRTESLVQNGMDNLMEGRTVFVIAPIVNSP